MIFVFNLSGIKFLNVKNTVIQTFSRLCELFEEEIKNYNMKYPDPTDERHPSVIDPTGALGRMYDILIGKHDLMEKVDFTIT